LATDAVLRLSNEAHDELMDRVESLDKPPPSSKKAPRSRRTPPSSAKPSLSVADAQTAVDNAKKAYQEIVEKQQNAIRNNYGGEIVEKLTKKATELGNSLANLQIRLAELRRLQNQRGGYR